MIFQDPMTAFTPVYTIGWQIDEQIRAHERVSRKQARARTVKLLGDMGYQTRNAQPIATRTNYQEAYASAP